MTGSHSAVATSTGLTKILNKVMKSGPGVLMSDQIDSLVLSEVSSSQVVVFVTGLEVGDLWSWVHRYNYLFRGDHWSSETIVGQISWILGDRVGR